jgi:hypothetical protein
LELGIALLVRNFNILHGHLCFQEEQNGTVPVKMTMATVEAVFLYGF